MNLRRKKFLVSNKQGSKFKIKKSSIGLFALILIVIGISFLGYNYFIEKKDKIYQAMNLLLFDGENPKNIRDNTGSNLDADPDRTQSAEEEAKYNYQYIGVLEIPKIGLQRGFVSPDSKYNNVSRNITIVESASLPDVDKGNFILAAHSGNCYVCFFNKLWKLSTGDVANVYYGEFKYIYSVVDIYDVEKTGMVEIKRDTSKNTLTMITCTHDSDTKQTVYILELFDKQ